MNSQITVLENASSSSTPASGELVIYAKADGVLYYKNDAGTEVALTSGYTDEMAQDASAALFTPDDGDIDFTYNDAVPSVTATVKNDAITYAKMQNVSDTDKVLGRSSGGAGDVEEIPCTAAGRTLIAAADAAAQRTALDVDPAGTAVVMAIALG